MQFKTFALAALASSAFAASNNSLCDKYTTVLLGTNNASNQYTVLTLLVNTVVIGNYSAAGTKNAVPGILAQGTVGGETINLLPYFNGKLASSNRGNKAVAVNFLDDGGATPLKMNKPANGTSSNQYFLLTHLYQYFGALLGCSGYGSMGFPAYGGVDSMYQVHKFMALDSNQVTYFIEQVGLAATSFGVTDSDAMAVGTTLTGAFNYRCLPAAALLPNTTAVLNSICDAESCPSSTMSNCTAYNTVNNNGTEPSPSAATSTYTVAPTGGSGSGSGSSPTGSSTARASGAAAVATGVGYAGLAAMALAMVV